MGLAWRNVVTIGKNGSKRDLSPVACLPRMVVCLERRYALAVRWPSSLCPARGGGLGHDGREPCTASVDFQQPRTGNLPGAERGWRAIRLSCRSDNGSSGKTGEGPSLGGLCCGGSRTFAVSRVCLRLVLSIRNIK